MGARFRFFKFNILREVAIGFFSGERAAALVSA